MWKHFTTSFLFWLYILDNLLDVILLVWTLLHLPQGFDISKILPKLKDVSIPYIEQNPRSVCRLWSVQGRGWQLLSRCTIGLYIMIEYMRLIIYLQSLNPSNAKATFAQNTRTQIFLKTT